MIPGMGSWPRTAEELERAQRALASAAPSALSWIPAQGEPLGVAGVFVAFPTGNVGPGTAGDPGWAAAVLMRGRRTIASATVRGEAGAPYVPGLLALQCGPLLEAAVASLDVVPDVLLVNATGLDHPRGAGLALHLGSVLGLPTVGVTDRPLVAQAGSPGPERGDAASLLLHGRVVGHVVRTKPGVHPVIVHAAWRTTPETARHVALLATRRSRTPEPLRQARRLARTRRAVEEGRAPQAE